MSSQKKISRHDILLLIFFVGAKVVLDLSQLINQFERDEQLLLSQRHCCYSCPQSLKSLKLGSSHSFHGRVVEIVELYDIIINTCGKHLLKKLVRNMGNTRGKHLWETLVGNTCGKHWWVTLVGNTRGKLLHETLT